MGNNEKSTQPMVAQNEIFTKQVKPIDPAKNVALELLHALLGIVLWFADLLWSMVTSLADFFKKVGIGIVKFGIGIYKFFKRKVHQFKYNDKYGRWSFIAWGVGSYAHGQKVNGIMYMVFEVVYIVLFAVFGARSIGGLECLGTVEYKQGVTAGDNSILILIFGLLWLLSLGLFFYIWNRSINAGYTNYRIEQYTKYEKIINANKEFANEIDKEIFDAFDQKVDRVTLRSNLQPKFDAQIAKFESEHDKEYTKYLLSGLIANAFAYKRQLRSREKAVEKAKARLEWNIEDRRQGLENLIKSNEQEREVLKAKFEGILSSAKDEVAKEEAQIQYDVEYPRALEKLEVREEIYKNKTLQLTSKLTQTLKKKEHLVDECKKRYANYIEWQSTHCKDKYGKFNNYFKKVASLDNELLFYKNYDHFHEVYNNSLGGADKANEDNKTKSVTLIQEKDAKVAATNKKFDEIYARKAEFEKQIKEVKAEYDSNVAAIKAENAPDMETKLLDAKSVLIEKTTRISNAMHDLPSDKAIKGMYKEEMKETKHAFKRDKKYLKTDYTPETFAFEQVVNDMLLNYRISYEDAIYFSKAMVNPESKEFLSKEEVDSKIKSLEEEKKTYIESHQDKFEGKSKSFKEQFKALFNENFHITILTLPILGIVLMTIIPLLFSIVIAFTNYSDPSHIPPTQLFGWVFFDNFVSLFAGKGQLSFLPEALGKTLGWTVIWALAATFTNYILGIIVALMINKKGIKLKKLWRTVFVMTIAIPQFISLLSISVLLKDNGAIDALTGGTLHFAHSDNIAMTKFISILVNIWIGIPYTILSTTGILLNIPEDLYESARVDGAGTFKQFTKITMPYILFVTGPYLITQFIGNFNNFNVIYFLTAGEPRLAGAALNVGETDILITFLFKLITSGNNRQFGIASTIGIFIFIICAFVSIVMYNKSGAIKEEDQFQ